MLARSTNAETGANGQGDLQPATGAAAAVSREVHNVLADAEDLIRATTSLTGADLARVRAQLAKGVAAARQSLEDMGGAIADGARKSVATTNAYVHAEPWKVIGASAAIGLLLGIVIARRR